MTRAFSLIELIIVLVLIACLGTLGGIKIVQGVGESRFHESVRLLNHKLINAGRLAHLSQGAVVVTLQQDPSSKRIIAHFEGEQIPTEKARQLFNLQDTFPGIDDIIFTAKNCRQTVADGIIFRIHSNGLVFTSDKKMTQIHNGSLEIISGSTIDAHTNLDLNTFGNSDDENKKHSKPLYPDEVMAQFKQKTAIPPR